MTVFSTSETIAQAVETFYLDREGKPELIPIGLPPIDRELGGLGPRACGILAAATGVGKSSAMLTSMLANRTKVGAVSVEDGPDVVGARLISALSGVDSMRIRRKDLTEEELERITKITKNPKLKNMYFSYPTAGTVDDIEKAVDDLCAKGCRMVWLDYLQKVRGHRDDRRHEVAETFTRFQRAVARGGAAGMAISQFRRLGDGEKIPQIYHLKESGDLENEARLIVLAHKHREYGRVRFRVGKSTYGGEHITFDYKRDASGTLREVSFLDYANDEDF